MEVLDQPIEIRRVLAEEIQRALHPKRIARILRLADTLQLAGPLLHLLALARRQPAAVAYRLEDVDAAGPHILRALGILSLQIILVSLEALFAVSRQPGRFVAVIKRHADLVAIQRVDRHRFIAPDRIRHDLLVLIHQPQDRLEIPLRLNPPHAHLPRQEFLHAEHRLRRRHDRRPRRQHIHRRLGRPRRPHWRSRPRAFGPRSQGRPCRKPLCLRHRRSTQACRHFVRQPHRSPARRRRQAEHRRRRHRHLDARHPFTRRIIPAAGVSAARRIHLGKRRPHRRRRRLVNLPFHRRDRQPRLHLRNNVRHLARLRLARRNHERRKRRPRRGRRSHPARRDRFAPHRPVQRISCHARTRAGTGGYSHLTRHCSRALLAQRRRQRPRGTPHSLRRTHRHRHQLARRIVARIQLRRRQHRIVFLVMLRQLFVDQVVIHPHRHRPGHATRQAQHRRSHRSVRSGQ